MPEPTAKKQIQSVPPSALTKLVIIPVSLLGKLSQGLGSQVEVDQRGQCNIQQLRQLVCLRLQHHRQYTVNPEIFGVKIFSDTSKNPKIKNTKIFVL